MSSSMMILLRVLHITTGVFWVGAVMFFNIFLAPSLAALGPDGAKVMPELVRRGYFPKMIIAATTTVITGLLMVSAYVNQVGMSWFSLPFGRGISTGMLAAIIAWVLGVFILRPSLNEMMALGPQAAQASGAAKDALMAQIGVVRARLMKVGMTVMLLLLVAVIAMAVARYM